MKKAVFHLNTEDREIMHVNLTTKTKMFKIFLIDFLFCINYTFYCPQR